MAVRLYHPSPRASVLPAEVNLVIIREDGRVGPQWHFAYTIIIAITIIDIIIVTCLG